MTRAGTRAKAKAGMKRDGPTTPTTSTVSPQEIRSKAQRQGSSPQAEEPGPQPQSFEIEAFKDEAEDAKAQAKSILEKLDEKHNNNQSTLIQSTLKAQHEAEQEHLDQRIAETQLEILEAIGAVGDNKKMEAKLANPI